jgi:hypothetical protein
VIGALGDQLDRHHGGCVTDPPPRLDHSGVAAIPVTEPTGHVAEQLRDHVFVSDKPKSLPTGVHVTAFPQGDHAIREPANLFGLLFRGLDPLAVQ